MNIGQPRQLKYQRGNFTHRLVGRLHPNVKQRCLGWPRDCGMAGENFCLYKTPSSRNVLVKLL